MFAGVTVLIVIIPGILRDTFLQVRPIPLFLTGIYDKIQLLRTHPRLGQRYEPIVDREVRETLYGHYRIAYLLVNEERIEILGVFHGAMDIERYLQ